MGLFADTVPRDLYDALQARYDDLLAKYHSLRPTHAPVAPMRQTAPKPEPGVDALHAIERSVTDPRVALVATKLMHDRPSLTKREAMIEAKRLDDIARGRTLPAPAVSGVSVPPVR